MSAHDLVARARKACEGVAPGPWGIAKTLMGGWKTRPDGTAVDVDPNRRTIYTRDRIAISSKWPEDRSDGWSAKDEAEAVFICEARELVPALADALEEASYYHSMRMAPVPKPTQKQRPRQDVSAFRALPAA